MEVREIRLDAVKSYEKNPRNNSKAVSAVMASIREFGFKVPIVVDADNVIVCGHTRVLAARQLGMDSVPCVVADDLTPEQIKAFRLADNKVSELATWDDDLLRGELQEIDINMTAFGFSMDLIDVSVETTEDTPPNQEQVLNRTKYGDIYRLGNHRLMCGDSTNEAAVVRLMDGMVADMLFTDPPYNVDYVGKTSDQLTIKNDCMTTEVYVQFMKEALGNAFQHIRLGGSMYLCHADSESFNVRQAVMAAGWMIKQCIIWAKNVFVMGRQDYQWKHEPILYGWKPGGPHRFFGGRNQSTVWEIDRPAASREHPTMKPIALVAKAIENSSLPGEIVLDLFGGSGSTMVAAEQLKRRCFMMEMDPKYCDVILTRWENLTGEKAELIGGEEDDGSTAGQASGY